MEYFLDFFPLFFLLFLEGGMMVGEQGLDNICCSFLIKAEKWAVMSGSF